MSRAVRRATGKTPHGPGVRAVNFLARPPVASLTSARVTSPDGAIAAAPPSTSRFSGGQHALLIAVFFLALSGSCLVLGSFLPFPAVPLVWDKIEQLTKHGDEYDVLFLGSSCIHSQIIPTTFERVAREQGISVRAFNAGIMAMLPPEDGYYLEEMLRCPHRRLRWVFLEIMPLSSSSYPTLAGTERFSYWHDWDRTRLLTMRFLHECAAAGNDSNSRPSGWWDEIADRVNAFGVWVKNLGLFMERISNFGRAAPLLRQFAGLPEQIKRHAAKSDVAWDGWDFPDNPPPLAGEARVAYEKQLSTLPADDQRFDAGDSASWASLRAKIDRLLQAKITPILIIPPTVSSKRYFPPELAGQHLRVLDFSSPQEHPEYFTADHRLDWVHLNRPGSELFTEAIARKFAAMVKQTGS